MNTIETVVPMHLWAKAVKARDGFRCVECGSIDDLHAHHIIARMYGGRDVLSNGKTLCRSCHWEVHRVMHTHGRRRIYKNPMRQTTLRIPHALLQKAQHYLDEQGLTLTFFVRAVIQRYVAEHEPPPKRPPR